MEDYEYLWLLNEGSPVIGVESEADVMTERFIQSRTLFSRVPTDLHAVGPPSPRGSPAPPPARRRILPRRNGRGGDLHGGLSGRERGAHRRRDDDGAHRDGRQGSDPVSGRANVSAFSATGDEDGKGQPG
jgi:hypothetical protein